MCQLAQGQVKICKRCEGCKGCQRNARNTIGMSEMQEMRISRRNQLLAAGLIQSTIQTSGRIAWLRKLVADSSQWESHVTQVAPMADPLKKNTASWECVKAMAF